MSEGEQGRRDSAKILNEDSGKVRGCEEGLSPSKSMGALNLITMPLDSFISCA